MKLLPCICRKFVALALVTVLVPAFGAAQSKHTAPTAVPGQPEPAIISKVKLTLVDGAPAVEITSDHPIVPNITKLEDPLRLVIDLPNANMAAKQKEVDVKSDDISDIRLRQYLMFPPVARVTIDLLKPLSYTAEPVGNKLTIRLRAETEEVTTKPPTVSAITKSEEPVAVPVSLATSGRVVFADKLSSGAAVTGGNETTVLKLARGGEIHVCPGTTVSVTKSQNGRDLMVGMSTGAMETHYALDETSDAILTPDFRILLRGPGEFHYAIKADARGNTCMRALPGNTAPVIVSELMGDGTYEVQPSEQLVFHNGRVDAVDTALHTSGAHRMEVALPTDCGCPAPTTPVLLASAAPMDAETGQLQSMHLGQRDEVARPDPTDASTQAGENSGSTASGVSGPTGPETAALPALKPNEKSVHINVPPIVFQASAQDASQGTVPVFDIKDRASKHAGTSASPSAALPPQPTVAALKRPHHGFFGKIKGLMARIF
jgi:AMIN domain